MAQKVINDISECCAVRFAVGPNYGVGQYDYKFITVAAAGYVGGIDVATFYYHTLDGSQVHPDIRSLPGYPGTGINNSGEFYNSVNDFYVVQAYYPDWEYPIEKKTPEEGNRIVIKSVYPSTRITWEHFYSSTLTWFGEVGVSQGNIGIYGCTSIPAHLFDGFYYNSLRLGSTIQSIGDYAFDAFHNFETYYNHPLQTVDIPSSVTHIGRGAFRNLRKLKNIRLGNPNYRIEEYSGTDGIFYVGRNQGDNLDPNGYQRTYVVASLYNKQYDWTKFNRVVDGGDKILRLGHNGLIHDIQGYVTGDFPFKHMGQTYWLRTCQDGDINQSPLVTRHNGQLYYISR